MTIDQLQYFVQLARYQHVGKAAKAARISPSAISTAVSSLERELGCDLFIREGKRIRLAETGSRFLEASQTLLQNFTDLPRSLSESPVAFSGSPRLGASHYLASRLLAPAWNALQKKHPRLGGEISSLPTATVLSELASGALDFGLAFSPFRHPELSQTIVYEGQLVLAVRKGHPVLKRSPQASLKDLATYPAVIHKDRPGVDLCEAHPIFARYGIEPRIVLAFDSDDCAVAKVSDSDAWTMIPDVVCARESKNLARIRLPKDWNAPYTIAIVSAKRKPLTPALTELQTRIANDFLNYRN